VYNIKYFTFPEKSSFVSCAITLEGKCTQLPYLFSRVLLYFF
jgi:hypothetical protein